MAIAARALRKSLDAPEQLRQFPKGHTDIVGIGTSTISRLTFEPGWRWSKHVGPIAGTASCQANHLLYVVSGRLGNRTDRGEELEIGPGDVALIPPGHDGWVIGDEPCVLLDMAGVAM